MTPVQLPEVPAIAKRAIHDLAGVLQSGGTNQGVVYFDRQKLEAALSNLVLALMTTPSETNSER